MPTSAVPSGCLAGGGVGSGGDIGGLGALEQPQLVLCFAPILSFSWLRGLPRRRRERISATSRLASKHSRRLTGKLPLYANGAIWVVTSQKRLQNFHQGRSDRR
jgi:hypothetical protein